MIFQSEFLNSAINICDCDNSISCDSTPIKVSCHRIGGRLLRLDADN